MKSGNEAFDDAIRKRLSDAKAAPPEGVFEAVIEKRRKKRVGWIWLSVILLITATGLGVYEIQKKQEKQERPLGQEKREKSFGGGSGGQNLSRGQGKSEKQEKPLGGEKSEGQELSGGQEKSEKQEKPLGGVKSEGQELSVELGVEKESEKSDEVNAGISGSNDQNESGDNAGVALAVSVQKGKSHPEKGNEGKSIADEASGSQGQNQIAGKGKNNSEPAIYYPLTASTASTPAFVYPAMMLPADLGTVQTQSLVKPYRKPQSIDFREPSTFSVEVSAGEYFPDMKEKVVTQDTLKARLMEEKNQNTRIGTGYNIEISGFYRFKRHFSAGLGISYTSFSEEAAFSFTDYSFLTQVDTFTYYILFPFTPPIPVSGSDTTIFTLTHPYNVRHSVTYTTVAANGWIRYSVPVGRFIIEPQAGLTVNVYTKIKGKTTLSTDSSEYDLPEPYNTQTSFGISGALNAVFTWTENLGLLFRGGYSWGLDPFATRGEVSELHTNAFTVSGGVRWNFSKRRATKSYNSGSDIVRR